MISIPARSLTFLTALALTLGACNGDGGTPPGATTGTISGRVTEGTNNVAGAQIGLTGGATRSATTSAAGTYSFADLVPGNYSVAITPPQGLRLGSGETQTKAATVTAGQTSTVDWSLAPDTGGEQVEEIRLGPSSFSRTDITIAPGTRVRWINDTSDFHTITPENATQAGVWQRTETNTQGVALEHVFTVAGQTYRYRCEPHSADFTTGMVGVIRVQ